MRAAPLLRVPSDILWHSASKPWSQGGLPSAVPKSLPRRWLFPAPSLSGACWCRAGLSSLSCPSHFRVLALPRPPFLEHSPLRGGCGWFPARRLLLVQVPLSRRGRLVMAPPPSAAHPPRPAAAVVLLIYHHLLGAGYCPLSSTSTGVCTLFL